MPYKLRTILVEIIATLLISLFVYTGVSKLADYSTFSLQLSKSPFISPLVKLVAWEIPTIELIAAFLLAIKNTKLLGLYISLFLMTLFTAYIYAMLHYSYYIPCSCGGILSAMNWDQHLVFNAVFTIICIAGILLETYPYHKTRVEAKTGNHYTFTSRLY